MSAQAQAQSGCKMTIVSQMGVLVYHPCKPDVEAAPNLQVMCSLKKVKLVTFNESIT